MPSSSVQILKFLQDVVALQQGKLRRALSLSVPLLFSRLLAVVLFISNIIQPATMTSPSLQAKPSTPCYPGLRHLLFFTRSSIALCRPCLTRSAIHSMSLHRHSPSPSPHLYFLFITPLPLPTHTPRNPAALGVAATDRNHLDTARRGDEDTHRPVTS